MMDQLLYCMDRIHPFGISNSTVKKLFTRWDCIKRHIFLSLIDEPGTTVSMWIFMYIIDGVHHNLVHK